MLPRGDALRAVAGASAEQISASAPRSPRRPRPRRVPGRAEDEDAYLKLAASVDRVRIQNDRPIDPAGLLKDLAQTVRDRIPFHQTETGRALEHHEAALVGEDVCTVRSVRVGGLKATSIYAEFHTNAPFETVAEWVDPRSWPDRGPMLFKGMTVVDADEPVALGPPGDPHWHGVFHEEVQLLQRVNTLLHCDYWQQGTEAAGMTYDLSLSLDNEIDVDRGFLLVTNAGVTSRSRLSRSSASGSTSGTPWPDWSARRGPTSCVLPLRAAARRPRGRRHVRRSRHHRTLPTGRDL